MRNYSDKAGIQAVRINVMHVLKNTKLHNKYTSIFLNLRGALRFKVNKVYEVSDWKRDEEYLFLDFTLGVRHIIKNITAYYNRNSSIFLSVACVEYKQSHK